MTETDLGDRENGWKLTWNSEYWDAVRQYYWTPDYLGCRRKIDLCPDCGKKKPPKKLRSEDLVVGRLRRLEEPLNHIFNIFIRLLPDPLTGRVFGHGCGSDIVDRFNLLGREIQFRYKFDGNITQPDVILVGEKTLLGIELKVGAKSSLLQIAKYALVYALEQELTGKREFLKLVFLTPDKPFRQFWEEKFENMDEVNRALKNYDPTAIAKPRLARTFRENEKEVRDVLSRIELAHMTYAGIGQALSEEKLALDPDRVGDEALVRLIDGMMDELTHRGLYRTTSGQA